MCTPSFFSPVGPAQRMSASGGVPQKRTDLFGVNSPLSNKKRKNLQISDVMYRVSLFASLPTPPKEALVCHSSSQIKQDKPNHGHLHH